MNKIKKTVTAITAVFLVSVPAYALEVIPSGECVGVKLYTDGLVVVDTTPLTDINGKVIDLAAGYGIQKGDTIRAINGTPLTDNASLSEALVRSGGKEVTLTIEHNNDESDITLPPIMTSSGPKLGLWLRDSTAGLGTITCYIDNEFAALGHGICDIDTGNIMPVGRGIIQDCTITNIKAGSNGAPGAITGDINGAELGTINENNDRGLFGTLSSPPQGEPVEIAEKSEVRCAEAKILADIDGEGVKDYSIEIKRISPSLLGTKDMIIKITDQRLIDTTGGIVQGMSGAPLIQNGKLIGAVTHVFVNDPTRGYAIFIENMLDEANKIK